jgi:hypothetical protein
MNKVAKLTWIVVATLFAIVGIAFLVSRGGQ